MTNITPAIRRRFGTLKWLIPLGLIVIVIAYELGPSRWIYDSFGFTYHLLGEILVFATVGPLLALISLEFFSRWVDEKETADMQADLLSRARAHEQNARQLSDDTLQVLYATSLMIAHLQDAADIPAEAVGQIDATQEALNSSIENLRSHLLS